MQIRVLSASEAAGWDAYVAAHPEATFFHRSGWRRILEETLGHRSHYLYAEIDGRIAGILPLGHIRSRLFGNSLISTPFCVYGGIIADNAEVSAALDDAACHLAHSLGVDYLELRNQKPGQKLRPSKDLYVTFRKPLSDDVEANFRAIPRKQRAMIRRSGESGLVGIIDDEPDRLYRVYAESVRNLGTPVFPRELFYALKSVFGPDCEVFTVERRGHALSSVMSFYFRDQVLPYYGGGTRAARLCHANDFLYWELMRRGCERGVRIFDFGRSKKATGSYQYKCHWGIQPEPLAYEFELVKATHIPDLNPLNPKYRLFIAAWKHLPLPLSMAIGPFLARNLG